MIAAVWPASLGKYCSRIQRSGVSGKVEGEGEGVMPDVEKVDMDQEIVDRKDRSVGDFAG